LVDVKLVLENVIIVAVFVPKPIKVDSRFATVIGAELPIRVPPLSVAI
jgi:hypothetical protein